MSKVNLEEILSSPQTYRRLREEQKDAQFHQRYPEGMFSIQRWGATHSIFWRQHRYGGCHASCPIDAPQLAIYLDDSPSFLMSAEALDHGILRRRSQHSAFGRMTYYRTFASLQAAAERFIVDPKTQFPRALLQTFVDIYTAEVLAGKDG